MGPKIFNLLIHVNSTTALQRRTASTGARKVSGVALTDGIGTRRRRVQTDVGRLTRGSQRQLGHYTHTHSPWPRNDGHWIELN